MKYCCLLIVLLTGTSCMLKGKKTTWQEEGGADRRAHIAEYFPAGGSWTHQDSIPLVFLPVLLSAHNEQPLSHYGFNTPVIRFVYWHALARPHILRIDNKDIIVKTGMWLGGDGDLDWDFDSTLLTSAEQQRLRTLQYKQEILRQERKQLDSNEEAQIWMLVCKQSTYRNSQVPYEVTNVTVTPGPLNDLLTKIEESGFWNWAIYDSGFHGLDGSEWYLEVYAHGRHHVVHQWSPQAGAFKELCRYIATYSPETINLD